MKLMKCPRCEVNYLMEGETICSVCRKNVKGEEEPDEIIELCSECGEHPAIPGGELCALCRKEMTRRAPAAIAEDEIEPALPADSVATMDEIELDIGGELDEDFAGDEEFLEDEKDDEAGEDEDDEDEN